MSTMKKRFSAVLSLIVLSALLLLPTVSCGSGNITNDGIYHEFKEDEGVVDEDSWIKLTSDEWSASNGRSGTYRLDGKVISLYAEVNGEEAVYATGTLSGGTISLEIRGVTFTYVRS